MAVNEAHKDDDGKARVELIPPSALIEIGRVLEFGAKKYGANNWRHGMGWSRFYGAALRHLFAWFGGENKDGESDLSHLAHAVCCLVFLMECEAKQIGHDDRLDTESIGGGTLVNSGKMSSYSKSLSSEKKRK